MQKKFFLFLFLLVHSITIFAGEIEQQADDRLWVTVKASSIDKRTEIAATGMTLDEIDETTVSGIATKEIVDELLFHNFEICSCETLESQRKTLSQQAVSGYHFLGYAEMINQVQILATKNPDIISLMHAGKSIQERDLIVLRINTTEKEMETSSKPGIILIGNHHAREHITAEFCIQFAYYLAQHKNDPQIRPLIQSRDIFIMPMANPDGVEYDLSTFPYKYHRKNMRPLANHALGVDLNRNYDLDWGGIGASKRERQENYCGAYPFSEPETAAIKRLIEAHPNIHIAISYHSFGKLILYPWGYTKQQIKQSGDYQTYLTLTKEMAARLPDYRILQASNMYIVSGEAADWGYGKCNIYALTIEMMPRAAHSVSGFYPTDRKEIEEDISHNIEAALYAIEFAGAVIH